MVTVKFNSHMSFHWDYDNLFKHVFVFGMFNESNSSTD